MRVTKLTIVSFLVASTTWAASLTPKEDYVNPIEDGTLSVPYLSEEDAAEVTVPDWMEDESMDSEYEANSNWVDTSEVTIPDWMEQYEIISEELELVKQEYESKLQEFRANTGQKTAAGQSVPDWVNEYEKKIADFKLKLKEFDSKIEEEFPSVEESATVSVQTFTADKTVRCVSEWSRVTSRT